MYYTGFADESAVDLAGQIAATGGTRADHRAVTEVHAVKESQRHTSAFRIRLVFF